MRSVQRQRGNALLHLLLRRMDVFPMPVVLDIPDEQCFEMTWVLHDAFVTISCYADRTCEFLVKHHSGQRPGWKTSTKTLTIPMDFMILFTALCKKHLENDSRMPERKPRSRGKRVKKKKP